MERFIKNLFVKKDEFEEAIINYAQVENQEPLASFERSSIINLKFSPPKTIFRISRFSPATKVESFRWFIIGREDKEVIPVYFLIYKDLKDLIYYSGEFITLEKRIAVDRYIPKSNEFEVAKILENLLGESEVFRGVMQKITRVDLMGVGRNTQRGIPIINPFTIISFPILRRA